MVLNAYLLFYGKFVNCQATNAKNNSSPSYTCIGLSTTFSILYIDLSLAHVQRSRDKISALDTLRRLTYIILYRGVNQSTVSPDLKRHRELKNTQDDLGKGESEPQLLPKIVF
jgi:hypothetical protein